MQIFNPCVPRRSTVALGLAVGLGFGALAADPVLAERPKVGFLTAVDQPDGKLVIALKDGRVLDARMVGASSLFGSVVKMTVRDRDGQKHKLKADEVDEITMPVDDLWRAVMVNRSTDSVEEIWKTDFERIFEVEELTFHSVRHPRSKRVAIRQLINPGFDSRIRVYELPNSKEGTAGSDGISWFGGMSKAYLVIKDDGDVERVKQREYRKKVFPRLYADCPELLERFRGDLRKFKFFAEHVYIYDQMCPGPGSPTYRAAPEEP